MEIVDDDQYKALSFVAVANRGGNRPTEAQLLEWMTAPRPKPAQPGKLIKPGRPPVYKTTMGPYAASGVAALANSVQAAQKIYGAQFNAIQQAIANMNYVNSFAGGLIKRELVEPELPAEYGPDIPPETFVAHLVRLQWLDMDERDGLSVTPLGRALLRSVALDDGDSGLLDVVVLDANNELAYPIFIKRLAEAGDALLIDPYLRIDQLLAIRAYTTVSRVLISAKVKQEDRAGMAVLVEAGSGDHKLEIRVADSGVLHDRLIVSDDEVLTIGTSINTIGRQHPTVLTPLPEVAADAYRKHVEKWWEEAKLLAAYPPVESKEVENGEASAD